MGSDSVPTWTWPHYVPLFCHVCLKGISIIMSAIVVTTLPAAGKQGSSLNKRASNRIAMDKLSPLFGDCLAGNAAHALTLLEEGGSVQLKDAFGRYVKGADTIGSSNLYLSRTILKVQSAAIDRCYLRFLVDLCFTMHVCPGKTLTKKGLSKLCWWKVQMCRCRTWTGTLSQYFQYYWIPPYSIFFAVLVPFRHLIFTHIYSTCSSLSLAVLLCTMPPSQATTEL